MIAVWGQTANQLWCGEKIMQYVVLFSYSLLSLLVLVITLLSY